MKDLDQTMDNMENSRFNNIYGPIVARLESSTFSKTELTCIAMIYYKFTLQDGKRAKYMTIRTLSKFLIQLFKITDKRINGRIIKTVIFDPDCDDPKYSPIFHCTLNSFIRMFTIYFSRDLEERMKFVFSVYDEDSVGYLSREIVIRYITSMFEGEDDDEVFELRADMLEILFLKFDKDKDLNISYEEYAYIVHKQPAMIEFLGVVFPSDVQLNVVAHCLNLLSLSVVH